MAFMREHLRQMDVMNEEMIEDQEGSVKRLDRATTQSLNSLPAISYRHVRASPNEEGRYSETTDETEDE
ncbi:MAG: hypothetical protein Q9170_004838 [Blastenia crenularia]